MIPAAPNYAGLPGVSAGFLVCGGPWKIRDEIEPKL
jgi:hypothetical protein